jgi:hypothetical protein
MISRFLFTVAPAKARETNVETFNGVLVVFEATAVAEVKKLAPAVQKEVPTALLEEPAEIEKELLASAEVETSIRGRILVQLVQLSSCLKRQHTSLVFLHTSPVFLHTCIFPRFRVC